MTSHCVVMYEEKKHLFLGLYVEHVIMMRNICNCAFDKLPTDYMLKLLRMNILDLFRTFISTSMKCKNAGNAEGA